MSKKKKKARQQKLPPPTTTTIIPPHFLVDIGETAPLPNECPPPIGRGVIIRTPNGWHIVKVAESTLAGFRIDTPVHVDGGMFDWITTGNGGAYAGKTYLPERVLSFL